MDRPRISHEARIAQLEAALRAAGVPVPPWGIERFATIRANFRSGGRLKDLATKLGVSPARARQLELKWLRTLSRADTADCYRARCEAAGMSPHQIEELLARFGLGPEAVKAAG